MNDAVEARAASYDSPVTIQNIPLAQLRESPLNTRKIFDSAKLKELADSIREKGILTPLLVRPRHDADTTPEVWEILAGARRFRAAKLVKLTEVRCVICEVDDTAALEIITMENLQREDLSAFEEAEGFKALLDLGKYTVEELAKRLGKSVSYVYQRVKLKELAPVAAKALSEQNITPGHAILIARLEPGMQAEAVKEIKAPYRHEGMSVRSLDRWIDYKVREKKRREELKKNPPPPPFASASSGSGYQCSPAEKRRERGLRALAAVRIEAMRQIVDAARVVDVHALAVKLCHRSSFEAQKLACQALGIWPKEGKTGNFDFRKKLAARVEAARAGTPEMAQLLAALSLAPENGCWADHFSGGKEEIAALHAAGKAAGIDVEKLERAALSAAKEKAAGKSKAAAKGPADRGKGALKVKSHTSAKRRVKAAKPAKAAKKRGRKP